MNIVRTARVRFLAAIAANDDDDGGGVVDV